MSQSSKNGFKPVSWQRLINTVCHGFKLTKLIFHSLLTIFEVKNLFEAAGVVLKCGLSIKSNFLLSLTKLSLTKICEKHHSRVYIEDFDKLILVVVDLRFDFNLQSICVLFTYTLQSGSKVTQNKLLSRNILFSVNHPWHNNTKVCFLPGMLVIVTFIYKNI